MNIRAVKDSVATDLPLGTDEVTQLTEKVDAVSVYDQDERELSG